MKKRFLHVLVVAVGVILLATCAPVVPVAEDPPGRDDPECRTNADCDDGRFCNGAESCDDGECVSGNDPCPGECDEPENVCLADNPPTNEPADRLVPGLYTGTQTCRVLARVGSETLDWTDSFTTSMVVNDDGLVEGLAVGETETGQMGIYTETIEVVEVEVVSNGIVVAAAVTDAYRCENTCVYARDGLCDEIAYCALGTDCNDCGTLIVEGASTISIRASGERGIEYVSTLTGADDDLFLYMTQDCVATLAR